MRSVRVGGATKAELLSMLHEARVRLNSSAQALFADDRFTTSRVEFVVETAELSVGDLGFRAGATFAEVVGQAARSGLSLCPLELGPHLRLQFTDQPEGLPGLPPTQNRAPSGSLTIASPPISDDDQDRKGFYLRRIQGVLWLRGYRSGPDHVWSPEDVLVFARVPNAAYAPNCRR